MKIVIRDDEKKDKAVSAIIGTILIVAITVVLAATLYAVLGGFSGLIGKPTPTASMTVSVTGSTSYNVTFTSVSSNVSLQNTELKLISSSGTTVESGYNNGFYKNVTGSGGYLTFNTIIKFNTGSLGPLSSIYLIDTQTGGVIASQTNL